MPILISEYQSRFIPGRQIVDNIIVAQEEIHSMHDMKDRKGLMAIKVDLEKAYYRNI
jgi:hypothetical protein